jgi:glycosyltransferase involved in cell wall biosynthesis
LIALPWRWFKPHAKAINRCFDLYPDAAVAEGMFRSKSRAVRLLDRLMAAAYRRCEFVADIGSCMAERLKKTEPTVRCVTLTPWALVEPDKLPVADSKVRASLFGDAALGLLYSGSFGRAHTHAEFLQLARLLRDDAVVFCFAGRGHRVDELRAAVTSQDANVRFAGFAPEAQLEQRLAACDLQLVSLRPEWTGTVVPSKFFGALAAGRGVVFAGSPDSAIARWISEHQVGWVLTPESVAAVASELRALAADPAGLQPLRERCHRVYHEEFSRRRVLDRWDAELRSVLGMPASEQAILPLSSKNSHSRLLVPEAPPAAALSEVRLG